MKAQRLSLLIITLLLFSCSPKPEIEIADNGKKKDSVYFFIKQSKNTSKELLWRKKALLKAYKTNASKKIDSSTIKTHSIIAYQFFKLKDTIQFKKINKQALILAFKLNDSLTIGEVYRKYGNYYSKNHRYIEAYTNYNLAYKYFSGIKNEFKTAQMLYVMCYIKGRFRDYSGSETLNIEAIKKFKVLKKSKQLYNSYNHLALLQNDIKEYDRALFYHKKAIELAKKTESSERLISSSLNNVGITYLKKGHYNKALLSFNDALKNNSIRLKYRRQYARVLSNKAYCRLLMKDTINVEKNLNKALFIRDSLKSKGGILSSKSHLSKYYAYAQDTLKAINYARDANIIAKKIKNGSDYLESLMLLAKLDNKNASRYLEKHIHYNDSLQTVDRKTLNKFRRIAYETDEYIEETEKLSQQIVLITIISTALVLILTLLYFVKRQKIKNQKLMFDSAEQKANEEVYLLTLKQQEKLEKEKIKERNRIAEELHDGILGKLFGTRLGLGFLNLKINNETQEQYDLFLEELQTIEKEIRDVSHKLSDNFDSSQIGFKRIIKQLVVSKSKIGRFTPKLEFDENIDWQKINEITKANLYRITQEAIVNAIKHASAKNIFIKFIIKNNNLTLTIKDDGYGFNAKQKIKGIGLKHMKSRTEKLKGTFSVHSKIKEGTTIKVQIPI